MLFSRIATASLKNTVARRAFHASSLANAKVAVLGAAGGIGQPLSLLLKLSPEVDELACYDVVGTPGVAADLSHVSVSSSRRLDEECNDTLATSFARLTVTTLHYECSLTSTPFIITITIHYRFQPRL